MKALSSFVGIDPPGRLCDVARLPNFPPVIVRVPGEAIQYISEVPLSQLGVLSRELLNTKLFQEVVRPLHQFQKIYLVNVTDSELKAWKMILPAFVERCQSWKHKAETCQYVKSGQIPLLTGLEDAAMPLCSCSIGHIPKDLVPMVKIPKLETLLQRYATRVAISPVFSVSYMEPKFTSTARTVLSSSRAAETIPQTPSTSTNNVRAACGKKGGTAVGGGSRPPLQCSRCPRVSYCSQECQEKDWKDGYKIACEKLSR